MGNTDKTNLQGGPDLDTAARESTGITKEKESTPVRARVADERSGAPLETHGPDPSGDDPFVPGAMDESGGVEPTPLDPRERRAAEMAKEDPTGENGPSYEAHQGDADPALGGSTDPHNVLEHENSGLTP